MANGREKSRSVLPQVLRRLAALALCVYATLAFIGCAFADRIMFQPPEASYRDNAQIIKLESAPGVEISALYLPVRGAEYTILYSHGNAEDVGQLGDVFDIYRSLGLSVFAYDYRGYGTSQGRPSEKGCCEDIEAAYRHLTGKLKVPPSQVIIYGRSVGSGPAVWLASREESAGLVVECGFKSAFSVITGVRVLPFDKFPNIDRIKNVKCPVLIMHGRDDEVIRFKHGEALFAAAKEPKFKLWVDGAGHNDFIWKAGDSYRRTLSSFVSSLDGKTASASQ